MRVWGLGFGAWFRVGDSRFSLVFIAYALEFRVSVHAAGQHASAVGLEGAAKRL